MIPAMLDWFVLLLPLVLVAILLLVGFVGCEPGRIGPPPDPRVAMRLDFPFPDEVDSSWVEFRWSVSGTDRGPESPAAERTAAGAVFEHVEEPEEGRWVVRCAFFTRRSGMSRAWGEEACGPFLMGLGDVAEVEFGIEHGTDPGSFRVVRRRCPAD